MSLARAWRRKLFGASGAALLVPGTIAAAFGVLALAGGFGHLGSLGEVFSGPSIPAAIQPKPNAPGASGRAIRAALHIGATTTTARPGGPTRMVAARSVAPTGSPSRTDTIQGTTGSGGHSGSGGTTSHGSPPPAPRPPSPQPSPTAPAPAAPAPPPPTPPTKTPIDGVVAVGTSVTQQVPGPVGTLATQTLQSAGATLDQILRTPAAGAGK
jgi:hypothetical protein